MRDYSSVDDNAIESAEFTYNTLFDSHRLIAQLKVVLFYVGILVLWLVVARLYQNFGTKWIIPSVSAMWVLAALTCCFLKGERDSILKETKWIILGFLCFLLLYRSVIKLVSSISADQMAAALNLTIPAVGGMAVTGFLQSALLFISVMTPVGYLIYCGQKFVFYVRGQTKSEAYREVKDLRQQNQRRF